MTDTQAMAALEPCPFCNRHLEYHDDPRVIGGFYMHPGVVTDTDCVLSGKGFYEHQLAAWNRRAHSPEPGTIGSHIGTGGRFDPAADEPVGYLARHIGYGQKLVWFPITDDEKEAGWTETPLYAAPVPPPAGDAEAMSIVRPFAEVASAILAEAPAEADSFALFTDCQRNTYAVSMDELRALSDLLATPPSLPAQQGWLPIETWSGQPTGQANPVLVAVTGGDRPAVVGEAYFDPAEYDGSWWWAGTSYSDYGSSPIDDIMHGTVTHWLPLPAPPLPATPPAQDQKGVEG